MRERALSGNQSSSKNNCQRTRHVAGSDFGQAEMRVEASLMLGKMKKASPIRQIWLEGSSVWLEGRICSWKEAVCGWREGVVCWREGVCG